MTAPNMASITASVERSLQNCSLNHHQSKSSSSSSGGIGAEVGFGRKSSSSDSPENHHHRHHLSNSFDATLDLNSQISLPYYWEQCLDLKSGEIYYINWRTGMKAKEDPRTTADQFSGDFYSEDDDSRSSYDDRERSSSETSPVSSSRVVDQLQYHHQSDLERLDHDKEKGQQQHHVLVVAGCKGCLMYFMVPKQVEDCPKCSGQLLHFDKSDNGSP